MERLQIERTIWIKAPRERVWRAITDPKELEAWFSPGLPWEISALEVGGTVAWHTSETDVEIHIIEVLEPPRRFTIRWEPKPPETGLVTTFLLEEENEGTRLTVIETGFELVPEEQRRKRMEGSTEGYTTALESLKRHIEQT